MKIEGDDVLLPLPPIEELDKQLATSKTCNGSCTETAQVPAPVGLPKRKAKVMDPVAVRPLGESS